MFLALLQYSRQKGWITAMLSNANHRALMHVLRHMHVMYKWVCSRCRNASLLQKTRQNMRSLMGSTRVSQTPVCIPFLMPCSQFWHFYVCIHLCRSCAVFFNWIKNHRPWSTCCSLFWLLTFTENILACHTTFCIPRFMLILWKSHTFARFLHKHASLYSYNHSMLACLNWPYLR